MFRRTPIAIFSSIAWLIAPGILTQPATAYNVTFQEGSNFSIYDDDSDIGFTDWQVNGNNLLTQTGLFYRLGNTGTARSIGTLTQPTSIPPNPNPISLTYTNPSFDIDLNLELSDNGSNLSQKATVINTSSSSLNFYLYSYLDLATSNGDFGDTVTIDSNTYTATQSGDINTLTTTITESIFGSNTTLSARRAEVDAIDFNDDTLLDKLQFPASGNTPQLDGTLNLASVNDPVSIAYEWNYNLAAGESFEIGINSDTTAVPLEFSPSVGIFLVGIFWGSLYLKKSLKS